ncbi:MAG: hypothetical protein NVSMB64_06310 [Candidatus Velthaea sp.]
MTPNANKIVVAASGTPVQVTAAILATPSNLIVFQAYPGTTGNVWIGVAGMTKATGAGVLAALSATSPPLVIQPQDGTNQLQPSDYWVDADTSGNSVLASYWANSL